MFVSALQIFSDASLGTLSFGQQQPPKEKRLPNLRSWAVYKHVPNSRTHCPGVPWWTGIDVAACLVCVRVVESCGGIGPRVGYSDSCMCLFDAWLRKLCPGPFHLFLERSDQQGGYTEQDCRINASYSVAVVRVRVLRRHTLWIAGWQ